jgi:hypothetical protein
MTDKTLPELQDFFLQLSKCQIPPGQRGFSRSFIFHFPFSISHISFFIFHLTLIERASTTMKNEIWEIENGK